MTARYDVIVIGAGLGGLTAAATLARAGRKTLLIERNYGVGGAASTYKAGDLVVEASLHETADPCNTIEPKHEVLSQLGVLDQVEWVPTGAVYEVRGGPVGDPFVLPDGFDAARCALAERFRSARSGIDAIIGDMERISMAVGKLSHAHGVSDTVALLPNLGPLIRGWRLSVADRFARAFGDDEGVKCALGANLPYWHDDPGSMWWVLFAAAQGGFLGCGGRYIKGGSQRLSNALAKAFRASGGELLLRRKVTEILLDADGVPVGVVHEGAKGGARMEVRAPIVVSNAAPSLMAEMLPEPARSRFQTPYANRAQSISLFSVTFGLSVRPAEIGFTRYSTFLLPNWMTKLADYRRCADLFAGEPTGAVPAMVVVDYSAIESGMGGPPYPVSVVGVDQKSNWQDLDAVAYEEKRSRWRDAIAGAIDQEFPGFASHVTSSVFSTASTMHSYLNAPGGAVYGFAPLPPRGPIWKGWDRSPRTPIPGLYLASSYAGSGGYTGAILAGSTAARQVLKGS